MSDRESVKQKVKEIIAEVSQMGIDASEIDDQPDIVTRLGLQSTQILEITVEIENAFSIEFDDKEITEELWSSIPSLTDGILAKKGAA